MNIARILFIMIIIWMLPSCEQKNARLWVDFSNTSYGARGARTTAGDPYIGNFSFVDDAYSLLGSQVEFSGSITLTPSSFILPFTDASIGCEIHTIELSVPWYNLPVSERNETTNIDFCNPISWEIDGEIWPEIYNTISMRITSTQRPLYTQDGDSIDGVIWETPVLEVTVPGYTDADWPDQENDGIFLRRYLGNSKFRFDLSLVLPTIKDQYGKTALPIENYIYCSDYSNPGIVLPGLDGFPDFINPRYYGYLGLPDQGTDPGNGGTNVSLVLFPFENVELSEDTTLVFYVETESILTVYDNDTPAYKPDDKLMLVKDFYNHFGVRTE